MEKIIICDIDGCLINTSWVWKTISLLGIKDDATKWDFFGRNANALYNTTDKKLVKFLKAEIKKRDARVMFLTARDSSIEQNTVNFIETATGFKYGKDFYISSRPGYDKLESVESKRKRLAGFQGIFKIEFAIDDELKNCELFDKYNIPTLFWTIGSEPKLVNNSNLNLLTEYRAFVPLTDQLPKELNNSLKLKAHSLSDLSELVENAINEINYRKSFNEYGTGTAFNTGKKSKTGENIFTGDILKTPEQRYCTAIWDSGDAAVRSPGSNAIDFVDDKFFNSCEVVTNLRHCMNFYETLEA